MACPDVSDATKYVMIAYCVIIAEPDYKRPSYSSMVNPGETTLEAQFRKWVDDHVDSKRLYRMFEERGCKPITEDDANDMLDEYVFSDSFMDAAPFSMHGVFRHRETGEVVTADLVNTPEFRFNNIVKLVLNEMLDAEHTERVKQANRAKRARKECMKLA